MRRMNMKKIIFLLLFSLSIAAVDDPKQFGSISTDIQQTWLLPVPADAPSGYGFVTEVAGFGEVVFAGLTHQGFAAFRP